MRSHRRMVLIDRLIPFLAAGVGLLALIGAVVVQWQTEATARRAGEEIAALRTTIEQLSRRTDSVAATAEASATDGTIDAMLALQERMNGLEGEWQKKLAEAPAVGASPAPLAFAAVAPGDGTQPADASGAPRDIDPSWPTENCIPLGTRFMVVPDESFPICLSPAVVKVSAITSDNVAIEGAGVIVETGFGNLAGTPCTILVFSADIEGFAELRVTCT